MSKTEILTFQAHSVFQASIQQNISSKPFDIDIVLPVTKFMIYLVYLQSRTTVGVTTFQMR